MTQKAKGISSLPSPVDPLCLGHLVPAPASLYGPSSQERKALIYSVGPSLLSLLVKGRRPLGFAKIAPSKQAPGQLFFIWESGPSPLGVESWASVNGGGAGWEKWTALCLLLIQVLTLWPHVLWIIEIQTHPQLNISTKMLLNAKGKWLKCSLDLCCL